MGSWGVMIFVTILFLYIFFLAKPKRYWIDKPKGQRTKQSKNKHRGRRRGQGSHLGINKPLKNQPQNNNKAAPKSDKDLRKTLHPPAKSRPNQTEWRQEERKKFCFLEWRKQEEEDNWFLFNKMSFFIFFENKRLKK